RDRFGPARAATALSAGAGAADGAGSPAARRQLRLGARTLALGRTDLCLDSRPLRRPPGELPSIRARPMDQSRWALGLGRSALGLRASGASLLQSAFQNPL